MKQHRFEQDLAEHQPPAARKTKRTNTSPPSPLLETLNATLPPPLTAWSFPSINNEIGDFGENWSMLDSPPSTPPPPPTPWRFSSRIRARSSPATIRLDMIRNPCLFGLIDEEYRGSDIDKRTIELFHELHRMRTLHAEERHARVPQIKAQLQQERNEQFSAGMGPTSQDSRMLNLRASNTVEGATKKQSAAALIKF